MKIVILAGGGGTRLWPISRDAYPKQFLKIGSNSSLLQATVERALAVATPQDIFVATSDKYRLLVKEQLKTQLGNIWDNVIVEPEGRNTAPAIALSLKSIEGCNSNKDDIVLVCPADHIIPDKDIFLKTCKQAEVFALQNYIVLLGILPNQPETGYGYIKKGESVPIDGYHGFQVERFIEKPTLELATQYVTSGDYYFNSGIFMFKASVFWAEIDKHSPDISTKFSLPYSTLLQSFSAVPSRSFDYAVMEKTDKAIVLPFPAQWSDAGVWDSVWDLLPKNEQNNYIQGDVILDENVKDCFIWNNGQFIAAIGLENVLIVSTEDAILVAARKYGQSVKDLVARLEKSSNKRLVLEHPTTNRPWGTYVVLESGARYKVKKIVVNPGHRLSLQRHLHRSEHWVIIRGTAKVSVADKELLVHENESIYINAGDKHRLENPGKIPLELIEVQTGEYLEEDDIERFADDFQRS